VQTDSYRRIRGTVLAPGSFKSKRVMLDLQEGETANSYQASLLATLQGVISLKNYICITTAKNWNLANQLAFKGSFI